MTDAFGDTYVRDLAYRSSFVPLQAPAQLSYVAARAGFAPPDPALAFRYVEFGCGSGVTLNALAAACPQGQFIGVDFNAASIAEACSEATRAGLGNVTYLAEAFSALDAARFAPADYVACAGTWSWLDAAEKAALTGLLQATLRPGGLLLLGFVTIGRAAVTPMWEALRALVPDAGQGSMPRVKAGIRLLAALRDHGARYLEQNASASALLAEVQAHLERGDERALQNVSHNLLAAGFRQQLLSEVAAELAPAGLQFCGAAAAQLNDPDFAVPAALRAHYDALPGSVAKAVFQDFLDATISRADVFISRAAADATGAARHLHERVGLVLAGEAAATWQRLQQPGRGRSDDARPVMRHVFERLAAGESRLEALLADGTFPAAQVTDAFHKLAVSGGFLLALGAAPPQAPVPARLRPGCAYNQLALAAAQAGAPRVQLAAPLLGSCIALDLPASLLVAEFCANGVQQAAAPLHQRLQADVARMTHIEAGARERFAATEFFAGLHRATTEVILPTLLRVGALVRQE